MILMKKLFNLQLFAGELNTNTTGSEGVAVEDKTFYDRALIHLTGPNLIHGQFGQKRNIPKNGGTAYDKGNGKKRCNSKRKKRTFRAGNIHNKARGFKEKSHKGRA